MTNENSIHLEDIKPVWYFFPNLESILFLFVTCLLPKRCMFLLELLCSEQLKSLVVCAPQSFSV